MRSLDRRLRCVTIPANFLSSFLAKSETISKLLDSVSNQILAIQRSAYVSNHRGPRYVPEQTLFAEVIQQNILILLLRVPQFYDGGPPQWRLHKNGDKNYRGNLAEFPFRSQQLDSSNHRCKDKGF